MEVRITCPLGSKCEEAKDGYIERCAWYTELAGKDGNTWKCAMAWSPILHIESSITNRSIAAAVESNRNVIAKGQHDALCVIRDIGLSKK